MMKEYKFEPQSQMIDVLEGATINVQVKSTRVAYRYRLIVFSFRQKLLNDQFESHILCLSVYPSVESGLPSAAFGCKVLHKTVLCHASHQTLKGKLVQMRPILLTIKQRIH